MGITASIREDGEAKQAMRRAARKTVVLGSQKKLGVAEFFKVADFSEVNVLVTELPSIHHSLDPFRSLVPQIQ